MRQGGRHLSSATYERDMRRWRKLGEAPVNVADAIPEVAAASGEVATTATAPDAEPPASDGQRNSLFATCQVAAQVAAQVRSTVPPVVVGPRKCTGRDLNPYASRRRNLNSRPPNRGGERRHFSTNSTLPLAVRGCFADDSTRAPTIQIAT